MQQATITGEDSTWAVPTADGPVAATLRLPGSKSITNRALVIAALADGPSVIAEPLRARDTLLMADALRALGARIEDDFTGAGGGPDWRVTPGPMDRAAVVDVGNAGTVMRFVPPVAPLAAGPVSFHGDPRASARPVEALLAALRALGADIDDGGRGAIPFTVHGGGALRGGQVVMDASASSQLVSGLLLAGGRYSRGLEIRHEGPPVPSAPHIAMTVAMLTAAGADVTSQARGGGRPDTWRVAPAPLAGGRITVEPDLSNSAPFLAAALVTGGTVTIAGWPEATSQPAGHIIDLLTRMGAACSLSRDGLTVTGGAIHGVRADLRDCNELAPVLTSVATLADGPSTLTGIGHMRTHETDRLAALATEIGKLGGQVVEQPDGLEITPRPLRAQPGETFDSYDDHRLVMAAAVLGLAVPGVRVPNVTTVAKTFPGFPALWARMLGTREPGAASLTRRARHDGLDEDDIRVRPGRGSRPRTRTRPKHSDATEAFVASVDRGRYGCLIDEAPVTAMKARELGRRSVVVGDRVALAGDTSGAPGTLARIVRVRERSSALRRSADDTDPVERVIVANADQLVIVCALANPPPRLRLIDRFLVAAYDAGLAPLLCLTKADLASPEEILAVYQPLGFPCVVTGRPLADAVLDELRGQLTGRESVLVGHSGVGKSTLVNALVPDASRAVGSVNPVTGRGRHTSSSAVALRLPGNGGWLIDTPGLRSFGLGLLSPDRVVSAFPDLADGVEQCPPGCTHLDESCALDGWVAEHGGAARLDSLRRLLRSREGIDPS